MTPHEVTTMPLSALEAAPYNPREISPEALEGLQESLKRFGLVQPIVWNKRTRRVVGGHQRVKALEAAGAKDAQVVVVDLDERDEKALNLTLNNPAIAGTFTTDLGPLLAEMKLELPEFAPLMLAEMAPLIPKDVADVVEDEVPEPPKVAVTKPGDVWTLGAHRLLCGDATNAEHARKASGGGRPLLMVTDPPYGVEYDPAWRDEAAEKGLISYGARRVGEVSNDDRVDWREAWALFTGDVAYVWHASRHGSVVQDSIEAAGFLLRSQIVWAKRSHVISRGHYHWQHEACWYAVRKGAAARWCGDRSQTTLWSIALDPNVDGGHSTQKPVEIMARPLRNHAGDVYDPFLGSGTTLIAAEQLGRHCFGLEIEPRYCDVVVERWQNLTGGKARRA